MPHHISRPCHLLCCVSIVFTYLEGSIQEDMPDTDVPVLWDTLNGSGSRAGYGLTVEVLSL